MILFYLIKKLDNNRNKKLLNNALCSYRRALSLLRKKRFQEEQLNKLDKMLENIEKMTSDIEFKQVEMNVLDGLKAGNAALKKLHQLISVDEIERIMDETKDGIEKQQVCKQSKTMKPSPLFLACNSNFN